MFLPAAFVGVGALVIGLGICSYKLLNKDNNIYCSKCRNKIDKENIFCPKCGQKIPFLYLLNDTEK